MFQRNILVPFPGSMFFQNIGLSLSYLYYKTEDVQLGLTARYNTR
jgi:hypothetical protein